MITPSSLPTERAITSDPSDGVPFGTFDRPYARISWGAVFAGAIIALASQLVLTLVGMAIGLATLSPGIADSPSGAALSMGAGLWLLLSSVISLFVGGYIAARLGGTFNGWLHGLTTWGTVTLMTVLLLTTAAGSLIGAASGLTNFAVSNSGKASGIRLPAALQQQVDQLKTQANQSADQATAQAQSTDPAARDAQVRDAGQKAAKGGAVGTGAAALGMMLGALAAAVGGKAGQRHVLPDGDAGESIPTTTRPSRRI